MTNSSKAAFDAAVSEAFLRADAEGAWSWQPTPYEAFMEGWNRREAMTTPSETRAGKLPIDSALAHIRGALNVMQGEGLTAPFDSLAVIEKALGALPVDCDACGGTKQVFAENGDGPWDCYRCNTATSEALAASEPVEAVCEVMQSPSGIGMGVWLLWDKPAENYVGCKLYTHPAPEQQGNGERCDDCGGELDGNDQCAFVREHSFSGDPQPSDPAEGEARAFDLGFEWRQMLDGHVYDGRDVGRTMLAHIFDGLGVNASVIDGFDSKETAIVKAKAEIKRALSTPPTAAVVTREAIKALVAGPFNYHHKMNELQEREAKAFDRCRDKTLTNIDIFFDTRAALIAALDPQVKR